MFMDLEGLEGEKSKREKQSEENTRHEVPEQGDRKGSRTPALPSPTSNPGSSSGPSGNQATAFAPGFHENTKRPKG